jgi:hypothetical protein
MLVGQITRQFIVVAYELPTGTIQGLQTLGHASGAHPVHDAHGLDAALAQVKERAVVVARGQGLTHFLQPFARVVGAPRALRQRGQQGAHDGAWNQPVGSAHESGHGATGADAS